MDGQKTDREIRGQRDRKTNKQMAQGLYREMAEWRKKEEEQTGIEKGPKARMGKGQFPAVRTDGRDTADEAVAPLSAPPRAGDGTRR